MKRLITSAAVAAALLTPLALAGTAVAAPTGVDAAPSGTVAQERPFTVDPVTYSLGEPVTVTGSATPGAKVGVTGLPGAYVVHGEADADGSWSVTSPEVAGYQIPAVLAGANPDGGGVFQEYRLVPASMVSPY